MISDESQRVLLMETSASSLVDVTESLNDFRKNETSLSLEVGGYLYIGQYMPFNSRYIDITTAGVANAALSVDVWNGSKWLETVDVRDRTNSFNNSGYLAWRIDRDNTGWIPDDTDDISDLAAGPRIYRFYWIRIKTDTNLGAVSINYLGNLFSTDDDMYSYYPALDNQVTRDQWEPTLSPGTKTDWLEQGFMASEMIVRDLKTRNEIRESGQILDAEIFNTPNIHLQASIIFAGLGRGFEEDKKGAQAMYERAMNLSRKNLDKCIDGDLDGHDRHYRTEFASR